MGNHSRRAVLSSGSFPRSREKIKGHPLNGHKGTPTLFLGGVEIQSWKTKWVSFCSYEADANGDAAYLGGYSSIFLRKRYHRSLAPRGNAV